jgi:hypothetical protein
MSLFVVGTPLTLCAMREAGLSRSPGYLNKEIVRGLSEERFGGPFSPLPGCGFGGSAVSAVG